MIRALHAKMFAVTSEVPNVHATDVPMNTGLNVSQAAELVVTRFNRANPTKKETSQKVKSQRRITRQRKRGKFPKDINVCFNQRYRNGISIR